MTSRAPFDDFAVRMAAFYAALFVLIGIQMLLVPVWLGAKRLDPQQIASVLAAAIVVRIVAVPVISRITDRFAAFRITLVVAAAAAVLGLTWVGLSDGFVGILCAYAAASVPLAPIGPLADAYALKGLDARGRSYGPVRLWGSIAYIAGNVAAGLAIEVVAAGRLVWLLVGSTGLVVVAAATLRPLRADAPRHRPGAAPDRTLLRSPRFLLIAAAACLIQASHALYYNFSAIDWSRHGMAGPAIGALWAVGVIAEIVLFAISARLPGRIDPLALIVLGSAGAMLRWSAMAADPPTWMLPPLQCLHALSFGATFLGSVQLVARIAADRRLAAAQGDLSTISSAGMALATALSGILYAAYGARGYTFMALIAAFGGGCALLASRLRADEPV
jgi:MFS transporter, PPP family, 3-phenylpropionic acid transporter